MAAFGTMPPLRVLITLWLLVIGLVFVTASKISDLRKCGDKDCTCKTKHFLRNIDDHFLYNCYFRLSLPGFSGRVRKQILS